KSQLRSRMPSRVVRSISSAGPSPHRDGSSRKSLREAWVIWRCPYSPSRATTPARPAATAEASMARLTCGVPRIGLCAGGCGVMERFSGRRIARRHQAWGVGVTNALDERDHRLVEPLGREVDG